MLNYFFGIGNLTDDPELRYTQNGTARGRFQIALNRYYTDREGVRQEETTFVPVVVWGSQAENCANYLNKGRQVCVVGRLRIDSFTPEDREEPVKVVEIIANQVQFLGGTGSGNGGSGNGGSGNGGDNDSGNPFIEEEGVPF